MNRLIILSCILLQTTAFAQTAYFEDFDSGAPSILGLTDLDSLTNSSGATETWQYAWRRKDFANGSLNDPSNFGLRSITNPSPAVAGQQSEDWVQLPRVLIPADGQLIFKFQAESNVSIWKGYPNLEIKISTSDSNFANYATIKTITNCDSWLNNHQCDLSAYAGQNVYLAIVNSAFNNPGWSFKRIFIDDIFIGKLENKNISTYNYRPEDYVQTNDSKEIEIDLLNFGSDTINSLELQYQINGGSIATGTIGGLSLPSLDSLNLIHPTLWTPSAAGIYTIKAWVSSINGSVDTDNSNDTVNRTITVFDQVTSKKPLLEIFGGSDCGACSPLARDIDKFVEVWQFNSALGAISNVEYQTFPNDPSDNSDAQIRDTFYSVIGYPDEQIEEATDYKDVLMDDANSTFMPFFDYQESPLSRFPAFVDIDLDAYYNENMLYVDVNLDPLVDFPSSNLKLHIAVCEKEYTFTGGGTSQSEFKHVVRKMLPNGYGTSTGPLTSGTPFTLSESYNFTIGGVTSGSFNLWEGMHNLEVVAFLQDDVTEEVFQSASLSTSEILRIEEYNDFGMDMYPNPSTGEVWINNRSNRNLKRIDVYSISGELVYTTSDCTQSNVKLDLSTLESGVYIVQAFTSNISLMDTKKLVITSDQ